MKEIIHNVQKTHLLFWWLWILLWAGITTIIFSTIAAPVAPVVMEAPVVKEVIVEKITTPETLKEMTISEAHDWPREENL